MKTTIQSVTLPEEVIPLLPKDVPLTTGLYENFTVSTDSVVATVRFKPTRNTVSFQIDWGDNTFSSGLFSTNSLSHHGLSGSLADGSLQLSHVYAEPEDKASFPNVILLKIWDRNGNLDFIAKEVTITPRYQVIHTPIQFRPKAFADLPVEDETYIITMDGLTSSLNFHKVWDEFSFGLFRDFGGYLALEGSRISHELIRGEGFEYKFEIREEDLVFDDVLFAAYINVNVMGQTGRIAFYRKHVKLYYYKAVILLAPFPPYDGPVLDQ